MVARLFTFAVTVMLVGSVARADINRSPHVRTKNVAGRTAAKLWKSMSGPVIMGDSLRTYNSSYKVDRAEDGLTQTYCEREEELLNLAKPKVSYRCTIEASTDGRPVPVFVPPLRKIG